MTAYQYVRGQARIKLCMCVHVCLCVCMYVSVRVCLSSKVKSELCVTHLWKMCVCVCFVRAVRSEQSCVCVCESRKVRAELCVCVASADASSS